MDEAWKWEEVKKKQKINHRLVGWLAGWLTEGDRADFSAYDFLTSMASV
jgi:hypothetical protein